VGSRAAGRDEELDDGGLSGTRLPAGQEVALGQGDGDLVTVLVLADRDRRPQRPAVGVDLRPGDRLGVGQRVTTQDHHPGIAGVGRVAGDADLADGQEGGELLGCLLQVGHLGAGGEAHPELLAGAGEDAAHDPRHPVIPRRQLGMAAGQRPPSPDMGAGQGAGQRLPGPGDQGHQEGGGHDHPVSVLTAELVAQPHIHRGQQDDERQFEAVGPGRPQHGQQQPVGRAGLDMGGDDRGWGFVQGAPAHRLAGVVTMRVHQGST
jgi:hypothetical protein